jgi:hypothetical protein
MNQNSNFIIRDQDTSLRSFKRRKKRHTNSQHENNRSHNEHIQSYYNPQIRGNQDDLQNFFKSSGNFTQNPMSGNSLLIMNQNPVMNLEELPSYKKKMSELEKITISMQQELLKMKKELLEKQENPTKERDNQDKGNGQFNEELKKKMNLIENEQMNNKNIKLEILDRLEEINTKLNEKTFEVDQDESVCSKNIALDTPTPTQKAISNSMNSSKRKETEMSYSSPRSKSKSKSSSSKIVIGQKFDKFVDKLNKFSGTGTNLSDIILTSDYLTTTYFVYLEHCIQGMKKSPIVNFEPTFTYFNYTENKLNLFFKLGYKIKKHRKLNSFDLLLTAHEFDQGSREQGALVCEEKLSERQLKFLFQKIKASHVLPVKFPVSTFKSLSCFINFVLIHFISVINFSLTNIPL